eukprot:1157887-Pelagomonas_calceolata.AAC.6
MGKREESSADMIRQAMQLRDDTRMHHASWVKSVTGGLHHASNASWVNSIKVRMHHASNASWVRACNTHKKALPGMQRKAIEGLI